MVSPLYFCLESLGQFVADGLGGPIIAAGALLEMIVDVCDADTEYQVVTARQKEREAALKREKKMARQFKMAADLSRKRNEKIQRKMAEIIKAMARQQQQQQQQSKAEKP